MNRQLAVQEVIALFLRCFRADFQHRITLEFDRFAATDADQMMVVLEGLVELIVLVIFSQIQFSQQPHPSHQLEGAIDRRQTDG